MKVYAISDQHYGHYNIIAYRNRNAKSADENAIQMIKAHNSIISNDDLVIFVGDVSCTSYGLQIIQKIVPKLTGHKVLVRGNHDVKSNDFYLDIGFISVHDYLIINNYLFCHYPNRSDIVYKCQQQNLTLVCGHTHQEFIDYRDFVKRINVAVDVMGYEPSYITDLDESKLRSL